jgi:hypothetical protein
MSLTKATFSMISGAPLNVLDFGAVGDGVTDNYAAILAAYNALPSSGGTIYFPGCVNYLCNTGLTWNAKAVRILGDGPGFQPGTGTRITFPVGVTGINPQNGPAGLGANSSVENIHIAGSNTGAGANTGLLIQCNGFYGKNIYVTGFGSHGIHVLSAYPTSDNSINANSYQLDHCRSYSNYGSGFSAYGVDSNVGVVNGIDCSNNAQWGIYDQAFLGTTYIGPHVSGNLVGGYRLGVTGSRVRIFGGYAEAEAKPGVQIDAGNNGYNNLDFLEMANSVTDNSVSNGNRITWTASSNVTTNKISVGNATHQYIALDATGETLDWGSKLSFKNLLQTAIWEANVLADNRLYVRSAQNADFFVGNQIAGPAIFLSSLAQTNAGGVTIGGTVSGTVGAAGAASALPANPLGYIICNVNGTQVKIPYYNN